MSGRSGTLTEEALAFRLFLALSVVATLVYRFVVEFGWPLAALVGIASAAVLVYGGWLVVVVVGDD